MVINVLVLINILSVNSIYYSQTCSNKHLYKMTTHLRRPMLSLSKQIPIQLLLYKTTTCLTRPVSSFFFISQMKKNLSKRTTTKLYPAKKSETNTRQQCIENKGLSDYIYSIATL